MPKDTITPENGDGRVEPRLQCKVCDDEHHPDDRDDHAFRVDVTCCPACGAKRATVIRDYDGWVGERATGGDA